MKPKQKVAPKQTLHVKRKRTISRFQMLVHFLVCRLMKEGISSQLVLLSLPFSCFPALLTCQRQKDPDYILKLDSICLKRSVIYLKSRRR
jgi:hypothetical protein